jgi:GPH family glycoside/pentoside/hexuronide:cation symporter
MTRSLPATTRHGYGVGAAGLAIANTAVMFFLLKYLVDGAGLSPSMAGAVLMIGKLWDAITDPIIGRLSDRTSTRFGVRRPWIALGSLPFVTAFAALWWGLPVQGLNAGIVYSLLFIGYSTAYTAVVVPYGALTPVLSRSYDERTQINAARMGWSMAGGIFAGIGVPMMLASEGGSWRMVGIVLGIASLVPLIATVIATKRYDRPVARPEDAGSALAVVKNAAFIRVVILFAAGWSTIAVLSAAIPFFVEQHMRAPALLDATLAAIQLSALAAIPLVSWLAGRFEKHGAYAITIASLAAVLVALTLLPAGHGTLTVFVALLTGPGVAAAHVLPWAMLPDVVDADRARTGLHRDGAFYGVMTFIEKIVTAIVLGALGLFLDLAGYVEGATAQPDSARVAILMAMGPLPAVALICAAFLAWKRPPMTRAEYESIVPTDPQRD